MIAYGVNYVDAVIPSGSGRWTSIRLLPRPTNWLRNLGFFVKTTPALIRTSELFFVRFAMSTWFVLLWFVLSSATSFKKVQDTNVILREYYRSKSYRDNWLCFNGCAIHEVKRSTVNYSIWHNEMIYTSNNHDYEVVLLAYRNVLRRNATVINFSTICVGWLCYSLIDYSFVSLSKNLKFNSPFAWSKTGISNNRVTRFISRWFSSIVLSSQPRDLEMGSLIS